MSADEIRAGERAERQSRSIDPHPHVQWQLCGGIFSADDFRFGL